MTELVEHFNWPIDTDMPGDLDLEAFMIEPDIRQINWDAVVFWNQYLADASKSSYTTNIVATDLLPQMMKDVVTGTDRDAAISFVEDVMSRIPRSEKRCSDHIQQAVSHVLRSVSDVAKCPFRLYDARTGIWRQEGQWISEKHVGTTVSTEVYKIIGNFEAALHRAVDMVKWLIDDVTPDPGPKPTGAGAPAAMPAWALATNARKNLVDKYKEIQDMARLIPRGKYRAIMNLLRESLAVEQTQWDSQTQWLVLRDGVIDLDDVFDHKRVQVVNFSPDYMSTMALDVSWGDPLATGAKSEWENGIKKIVSDDELRDYLQKRYGAALLGKPGFAGKSMVWQFGVGDTGKSTLQEAIAGAKGVFAPYSYQADAEVLTSKGADRGATDRFIAYVRGKRYAIISELDSGAQLNQGKFKTMTGGETVAGTAKYSNEVTYFFTPTLFVSSNHPPNLPYGDTALINRIHVVPFTNKLIVKSKDPDAWEVATPEQRADEQWLDKLLSDPLERASILHWVIDGLIMFATDVGIGRLPAVMQEARRDFVSEGDPVSRMVNALLGKETGWEKHQRLYVYSDLEWSALGLTDRDGVSVARVGELLNDIAATMEIVSQFDMLSTKQLNAAKRMLDELGGRRKTVSDGNGSTRKAFARIREVSVRV